MNQYACAITGHRPTRFCFGYNFELMAEESTCPLEEVKTEDGWADEIMAHMIRCKHCGQIFTCVVNTWRGSGHFKKGKG